MIVMKSVYIKSQSPKNIIEALCSLFEDDNDLNGENGEEYLWNKAKSIGFHNNLDYLTYMANAFTTPEYIIDAFFRELYWNESYYSTITWDYCKNDRNEVVAISMAYDDYN